MIYHIELKYWLDGLRSWFVIVEMKVQFFLMTFQTCVLNDYIMIMYYNDVVSVMANDVIKY
jgi:hypothetical protein